MSSSSRRARSSSYDPIKVGYPPKQQQRQRSTSPPFTAAGSRRQSPHDRALVRAMNSDLRPSKDHRSDPEKTLFIGRLNGTTDENAIKA
ncbi:hypothetical protein BLA29_013403, partial [Euroglyphus maynei]